MKNFLLNSLLLLLVSCSRPVSPGTGSIQETLSADSLNPPFSNGFPSYFFKTQSDIYGHYLSGLLLIKPFADTNYRIVFTTEVGIKLFDFEFAGDSFIVHYCMNKLNRKPVIKVLEKDFRLLLMNGVDGKNAYTRLEGGQEIFFWKENKEYVYYFEDRETKQLLQIKTTTKKGKPKVTVDLKEYDRNFPNNIKIVHDNIKLTIELRYIER